MGVGKNIKSGIDLLEDLLREVNKPAKAAVKAAPVAPTLLPAVPTVQAPAVMIPSRLNKLKETVRQSKGDYGARRVERAADEIPNLEALYNEQALRSAFKGDNAKALMTMNPRNFEHYARPLDDRFTDEFSTRHGRNGQQMSYREYMEDYLPNVGGFDDVPFLMISKEEVDLPLTPFITGHEGRHRNRVLANKGEGAGLVQLFSEGDLRTELPRKTQEDYIEALRKELGLTDNLVYPEKYGEPGESIFDRQIQRPAIKLPDIYAEGGEVHMGRGGAMPKKTTLEEDLKSFKDPALALADLFAGLGRGTTAAATGIAGDLEELYRQYGKGAVANAVRLMLPKREGKATTFPTIEEMNAMLPPVVPAGAGRSSQVADVGQFFGENNPAAPTALVVAKPVLKAALPLAKKAGQAAKKAATSDDLAYALENLESNLGLGPKQIMIGPMSKSWRKDDAKLVELMEYQGKTPEEIWQVTRTFRAPDGRLRQEISDANMKYTANEVEQKQYENARKRYEQAKARATTPEELNDATDYWNKTKADAIYNLSGKAQDFINHPELFAAYPDLAKYSFKQLEQANKQFTAPENTYGFYSPGMQRITINSDLPYKRSTALHELQHAIQDIEGWQSGSSPEYITAKMAERDIAKKEAKEIQDRIDNMRSIDPVLYEDLIRDEQIALSPKKYILNQTQPLEGVTDPYDAYRRMSGEEEARMVQARRDMGLDELIARPPFEDYEADPSQHITKDFATGGAVMMGDGGLTIEEFLRKQGY
jgi:hypothetical protein